MRVSDVMTRDVMSCMLETDLETVAMKMWNGDCGSIPVTNNGGTPVAMITDRDIVMASALQHKNLRDISANEVVDGQGVQCCNTNDSIETALAIMTAGHVHRLPVVDDSDYLKGVLSIDDVIALAERGKRGEGKPDLSYEDAMVTLKAVCTHH